MPGAVYESFWKRLLARVGMNRPIGLCCYPVHSASGRDSTDQSELVAVMAARCLCRDGIGRSATRSSRSKAGLHSVHNFPFARAARESRVALVSFVRNAPVSAGAPRHSRSRSCQPPQPNPCPRANHRFFSPDPAPSSSVQSRI